MAGKHFVGGPGYKRLNWGVPTGLTPPALVSHKSCRGPLIDFHIISEVLSIQTPPLVAFIRVPCKTPGDASGKPSKGPKNPWPKKGVNEASRTAITWSDVLCQMSNGVKGSWPLGIVEWGGRVYVGQHRGALHSQECPLPPLMRFLERYRCSRTLQDT